MEQPAQKNFNILISLLLMGTGAGLIFVPAYLGILNNGVFALAHSALGFFIFSIALFLQVISIRTVAQWKMLVIKGLAAVLLIVVGYMFFINRQYIGSAAMIISGVMQAAMLIPQRAGASRFDPLHWTVTLTTLAAGVILPFAGFKPSLMDTYTLSLAGLFIVTALAACASITFPSAGRIQQAPIFQALPWLSAGALFVMTGRDNLIAPAAFTFILLAEKRIPWNQLVMRKEDILSRRMTMVAVFTELAHVIFLGAMLLIVEVEGGYNEAFRLLSVREAALAFFVLYSSVMYYATITILMTTNGLLEELNRTSDPQEGDTPGMPEDDLTSWSRRLERYIKPFIMSAGGIRRRVQADQINTLSRQAGLEKKRNAQLTLLLELSQQLENQLDQPVSAQLTVNMLERALNCGLAVIFLNEPEEKRFTLLASTGRQNQTVPSGYQQDASIGVVGRALRQRKTQIVNDTRNDPDFHPISTDEISLSLVVVPLNYNGHIHGMIILTSENINAFGSLEVGLAESVAAELTRAWERSGYHQRLKDLIQTGSQLSSAPDPETTARDVASISRDIVQAKFTYIHIELGQDQSTILHASSGNAPLLRESLTNPAISGELIKSALHALQPFRVRDVRKYELTANLALDNAGLRSMLAIPIRWHHVNIGTIFAFGKQREVFFTENDESLAELISVQAGGAFESTWLQQELRASLRITSLLYRLSNQIIQSENIADAAFDIAQTAHKLGKNITTGIVLFDHKDDILAEIQVNDAGKHPNPDHPLELIRDTIRSAQMIYISLGQTILRTCLPIQTPIRSYGALWMDTYDDPAKPSTNPNDLQALVNQAAIALERSLLLVESRRQAKEIKEAYDTLEATYDQTLASLTSALDARDRETEGHSIRVTRLAVKLGEHLGYDPDQLKLLERGSILHDIGKIGISDNILHKPGPLTEEEWKIMRLHPGIGARIVNGIPFLQDTIQLIECHQERWDGSGYPLGLKGKDIPELARLFAIIDAFDALTSNRPYRQKVTKEEALEYLKEMSGTHFDPDMVHAFEALLHKEPQLLTALGE